MLASSDQSKMVMAISSSFLESNVASARPFISKAASTITAMVLIRSLARELLPREILDYVFRGICGIFNHFSSQFTMVIDEIDGLVSNQIYDAAHIYLGKKIPPSTRRVKVSKPDAEKDVDICMECDEVIADIFSGIKLKWNFVRRGTQPGCFGNPRDQSESRSLELSFHKKHKELVLRSYIPFIMREAKLMKEEARALKIFAVNREGVFDYSQDLWTPMNLNHPTTFETLALDPDIKNFILEDLERFVRRKEYYRKVGKAWKRGYLLYGPPGTGKSSLIAAMANYLHFNIYDLELGIIRRNSDLRRLMIAMANRSIIVVEDIDCSHSAIRFPDRPKTELVSLSGILNFIDGLWSSCGEERIIVFTTNHKEKIDPALLRPGRMDVHIHMSYCTPSVFRQLAFNYLELHQHHLFQQIEEAILVIHVTPAEVAEELLRMNATDHHSALQHILEFLAQKKIENEEFIAKKEEESHVSLDK